MKCACLEALCLWTNSKIQCIHIMVATIKFFHFIILEFCIKSNEVLFMSLIFQKRKEVI